MRRIRLTLEYDGGDFQGWQVQPEDRSVQGVLEEAIAKTTQESVRITGAGRTDAGVHATGQVAHFDSNARLAGLDLRRALNAVLPADVAVRDAREVEPDFHARYHAVQKTYLYRILNTGPRSPLRRPFVWHLRGRLELEAMRTAAQSLLGEHDFAAFRGTPGGAPPQQSTIRCLQALEVARVGDEVRVEARAPGFLRHMVRNLVGTLVEVGQGRRAVADPAQVLAAGDRAAAGPTAPPQGLCLVRVCYPGDPDFPEGNPET